MTDSSAQTDPALTSVSGVALLDTLESLLERIGYPVVVDWTDPDLLASD